MIEAIERRDAEASGELVRIARASLELALRRRILTMELPPGAVLDEVAVSEEFGLSRPPVRELMRLVKGRRLEGMS